LLPLPFETEENHLRDCTKAGFYSQAFWLTFSEKYFLGSENLPYSERPLKAVSPHFIKNERGFPLSGTT